MSWALVPLGGGYGRIDGAVYTTFVVITDEVTEAERDEYLRLFSHRPAEQGRATRWLRQWMRDRKMKQPDDIEDLAEHDEMEQKLLEAMPLEKRLAGLAPEQRLAGLPTEQLILALPVEVLRVLPEEYLRSLPGEVQEQVKQRLRGAAH